MVIARIIEITRLSGLVLDFAVDSIHNPFGKDSEYGLVIREVGVHPSLAAVHFAGGLL
jgi:hypothetical protein